MHHLEKVLYYFSLIFFLFHILLLIISAYDIGVFDGSLRLIAIHYSQKGYIPYKDFGLVYPPGYIFLMGKLFSFSNILFNGLFIGVMATLYVLSISFGLINLAKNNVSLYNKSILYFACSIVIFIFNYNDVLSIFYPLVTVTWMLNFVINKKTIAIYIIFLASLTCMWTRWDLPIFLSLIHLIIVIFLLAYSKLTGLHILKYDYFKNYLVSIKYLLMGVLVGIVLLVIYLWTYGILNEGLDFFVNIPIVVIGPYRNLPFPVFQFRPLISLLPYITIYFLLVFEISSIKRVISLLKYGHFRKMLLMLVLSSTPFVFLPYAIGRSDTNHFVPLWLILIIVIIIRNIVFKKENYISISMILLFIPFITIYKNNIYLLKPEINRLENNLSETISDCKSKVDSINASSIFVGRQSYDQYIFNDVILYFTRMDLKPGSTFISDEPGLQSSCDYGSRIAKQLSNSQKPLLTFLSVHTQKPENNLTATMKSCNKVEHYLNTTISDKIGHCFVEDRKYEIRIYY